MRRLLGRFPAPVRGSVPLIGDAHLRMAEGFLAMPDGNLDSGMRHCDFVVSIDPDPRDRNLAVAARILKEA